MWPFTGRQARSRIPAYRIGLVVVVLLHQSAPAIVPTTGPLVWTAPSLSRVTEDDTPRGSTSVALWAARGEYESFQIAVRPSAQPLTGVSVSISELAGPEGARIPQTAFALYREHYVTVSRGSPDRGGQNRPMGEGRYADALIPFVDPDTGASPRRSAMPAVPFTVAAERTQPVWVDVLVPTDATPGEYRGSYTVRSDQGSAVGQVTLRVWNFTLPRTPRLQSVFSFGNGDSGTPEQNRELLRHRLSPVSVHANDERVLIEAHGLTAGSLGFWSDANQANCDRMAPAPSVAAIRARAAAHQPGMLLYNYTADEIDGCPGLFATLKEWARNLHDAGVDNLVTMTPTPALFDDGSGSGRSAVDIWVVLPRLHDQHADHVAAALKKGDRVWSYNALVQDDYTPKWQIDYAPINFRIQPGFLSQHFQLTGLLYWKVDRWSDDPWHDVNNVGVFAPGANYPGEGMLLYPGAHAGLVGVAPSMRLKWLRDGVDDYDYVALLREAGRGDWATGVVQRVAPDWKQWERDPAALEEARRELGQELERLAAEAAAR